MSISNADRARVIVHALPYIKEYSGKVVVIKYGGNAMVNEKIKDSVMRDVILLHLIGVKVVLVHGGGPEISEMLKKTGKKSEFVNGLRVTDKETVETVLMVLAGKVNKSLVNLIGTKGARAVGLCGADACLIEAETKDEKLGYVGNITKVNPEIICDLIEKDYIPVISTVGCDSEGNIYNINADTAASAIASSLGAECLILMTDIAGILADKNDPDTLISVIKAEETDGLIEKGVITEGMIPKIQCCVDAVNGGVKKVFVLDGTVSHSILMEILTNEGMGTMVTL